MDEGVEFKAGGEIGPGGEIGADWFTATCTGGLASLAWLVALGAGGFLSLSLSLGGPPVKKFFTACNGDVDSLALLVLSLPLSEAGIRTGPSLTPFFPFGPMPFLSGGTGGAGSRCSSLSKMVRFFGGLSLNILGFSISRCTSFMSLSGLSAQGIGKIVLGKPAFFDCTANSMALSNSFWNSTGSGCGWLSMAMARLNTLRPSASNVFGLPKAGCIPEECLFWLN